VAKRRGGGKVQKSPAIDTGKTGGKITPLDPKVLNRSIRMTVKDSVRQEIQSLRGKDWLSPQQPVATFRPEEQAADWRQWDYPAGYNINLIPRKYEPYTFAQLRWLGRNFDLLREVIERRKNEISKIPWDIVAREGETASDDEIDSVKDMFRYPDGMTPFAAWQNAILEDMLVIDAPCIYPWPAMSGRIMRFMYVDGSTINILINEYGFVPEPPDPAYQQVIQGLPYEMFRRDELIYMPRNVRTDSPYGFSPVEQLITSIAIALKLEQRQLSYYTEGTIPELISVPENWTGKQIASFQAYWDNLMRGNLALRSGGVRFVPNAMKDISLKDYKFDAEQWEWLARMVCAAFNMNPQRYIRQNNRATAETAQVEQLQEGLEPTKTWWKAVMDLIIERYLEKPNLEWAWKDSRDVDIVEQANADASDVKSGIKAPNEVRAARGLDPYKGFGDEPILVTGSGPVLLSSVYDGSLLENQSGGGNGEDDKPAKPEAQDNADERNAEKVAKGSKKKSGDRTTASEPSRRVKHSRVL